MNSSNHPSDIATALVGYGYAGRVFHAPLIATCPELRLHTIVSRDPVKVQTDWPAVRVVADLDAALADPAIELVVIATPNALHAEQAEAALAAGRHVVVDKPFTLNLSEARRLIGAARSADRVLSVFHNRRWDADFLSLRALLDAGQLGRVAHFESRFDRFRPEPRARWREQAVAGGGIWFDLGPHLVDQALQLFGLPLRVRAQLACLREGAIVDDWVQVALDYPNLQVSLAASMLVGGGVPRFAVHGTRGSWIKFGIDPQEAALLAGLAPSAENWGVDPTLATLHGPELTVAHLPMLRGAYPRFYAGVAAAIRRAAPNPVPAEQALAVMAVICAAQHSARDGNWQVLTLSSTEWAAASARPATR